MTLNLLLAGNQHFSYEELIRKLIHPALKIYQVILSFFVRKEVNNIASSSNNNRKEEKLNI